MTIPKAVVLLSGGLDSTTCLAQSIADGNEPIALSFRYGQRHTKELKSAANVAAHYGVKHIIIDMDLSMFHSALTDMSLDVPENRDEDSMGSDIPITYVPARNIIMLSVAAGVCESFGADKIYIGVNSVDYSGYPDCRIHQSLRGCHQQGYESRSGRPSNQDRDPDPICFKIGYREVREEIGRSFASHVVMLRRRREGLW